MFELGCWDGTVLHMSNIFEEPDTLISMHLSTTFVHFFIIIDRVVLLKCTCCAIGKTKETSYKLVL